MEISSDFAFFNKGIKQKQVWFSSKRSLLKASRFLEQSKDPWMKSIINYEELVWLL